MHLLMHNVTVNLWGSSPSSSEDVVIGRSIRGPSPSLCLTKEAGMSLLGNNPKTIATVNKKTLHGYSF